jgi:hypothetical protein
MSAEEKQHDRMASRLAIIISRLLMGERLSVTGLSQEFRISERTLRRDFRERLSCLELTYRQGCWSLTHQHEGLRTNRDILHFARVTRTEQLFPAMDNRLISVLTDSSVEPPLSSGSLSGAQARSLRQFLAYHTGHSGANSAGSDCRGQQYRWFAPYRLIYFENGWYLVGEYARQLQVFLLESITDVCLTPRQFLRRKHIDALTADPHFIHSLPHFQYIRTVLAETEN